MRDASGHRADMPPPFRASPTTARTDTTHQDLRRYKSHSPPPIRNKLGFKDGLASMTEIRQADREQAHRTSRYNERHLRDQTHAGEEKPYISPRGPSPSDRGEGVPKGVASPFGARPMVRRREEYYTDQVAGLITASPGGGMTFDAPALSPRGGSGSFPAAGAPSYPDGRTSPLHSPRSGSPTGERFCGKKQFAHRLHTARLDEGLDDGRTAAIVHNEYQGNFAGAKMSQNPKASVELGDNAETDRTSNTLALREEPAKRLLKQCKSYDPNQRITEWQFRTREVASARSRQHNSLRWR